MCGMQLLLPEAERERKGGMQKQMSGRCGGAQRALILCVQGGGVAARS
jgi:hypothetical protein